MNGQYSHLAANPQASTGRSAVRNVGKPRHTMTGSPSGGPVAGGPGPGGNWRPAGGGGGGGGGLTSTGTNLFFPNGTGTQQPNAASPMGTQPQQTQYPRLPLGSQPASLALYGGNSGGNFQPPPQQPPPQQQQQQQQQPQQQGGLTLNTSIQPQDVYPQQYTNQAANLAATNVPAHNDLVAGRQRPGVSVQSPMTQAGMGADMGSALAQAMMARGGVQQQQGLANAQNQLLGQTTRDREGRGLMQLYSNNLGSMQGRGLLQDQGLMQLLSTAFRLA